MEDGVIIKLVHCRMVDLDECIAYFASRGYTYNKHEKVLMRKKEVSYYQKNIWTPEKYRHVSISKKVPVVTVTFNRKRTNNIDKAMELEKQICELDAKITDLKRPPNLGVMWMVIVWPLFLIGSIVSALPAEIPLDTKITELVIVGLPSLILTIFGIIHLCKACKRRKVWAATKDKELKTMVDDKTKLEEEMKKLYQTK